MKVWGTILLVIIPILTLGQDISYNPQYSSLIHKKQLRKQVYTLAADSLEGRGTGQWESQKRLNTSPPNLKKSVYVPLMIPPIFNPYPYGNGIGEIAS